MVVNLKIEIMGVREKIWEFEGYKWESEAIGESAPPESN